eukprot:scaffold71064_cov37-Prasinocladus_malaysianus.AAC.2
MDYIVGLPAWIRHAKACYIFSSPHIHISHQPQASTRKGIGQCPALERNNMQWDRVHPATRNTSGGR